MSKKLVFIILFILLGIGAAIFVSLGPDEETAQTTTQAPSTSQASSQSSKSGGAYVDYSEAALAEAVGEKVLFFHASWCPQCRALESDIQSQGVPNGFTILKVDYDSNQALRQKYGVTIQTTLVKLDDNDESVAKYVAYDDPTLEAVKRNLLQD